MNQKEITRIIIILGLLISSSSFAKMGKPRVVPTSSKASGTAGKVETFKSDMENIVPSATEISGRSIYNSKSELDKAFRSEVLNKADREKLIDLAEKGADVNAKDKYGNPLPLMIAIVQADLKFMKALIKAGADVNAKDKYGTGMLAFAVSDVLLNNYDKASNTVFIELSSNPRPFSRIERYINLSILERVTKFFPRSLREKLNEGRDSAVIDPSYKDASYKIIEELIKAGANVNLIVGYETFNPLLTQAAFKGDLRLGKLLVEGGAHLDMKNESGETAYFIARHMRNNIFANFLKEEGANTNISAWSMLPRRSSE